MKYLKLSIFLLLVFATQILYAQDGQRLKLLFVGDVMQHDAQLYAAQRDNGYDFSTYFKYVAPLVQSADVAVANLELTLAGSPYSGYPQFCAPDELAVALKDAGFEYIITANNHSCDKGKKGIERTIDKLEELQLTYTGTFKNQEERDRKYPLLIEKNGFKIALLNYTYSTNGIPAPPPNIVNLIDEQMIIKDLAKAKTLNPDAIIVATHWGREYERLQHKSQEVVAQLAFDHGADIVIGSHPHVVQPMERKNIQTGQGEKEVVVVYSLGNYVSNQRARFKDGGATVWIELTKNEAGKTVIDKSGYLPNWVYVEQGPEVNFYILPFINDSLYYDGLVLDDKSKDRMNGFLQDTRTHLAKYNTGMPELSYNDLVKGPETTTASKDLIYRINLQAAVDEVPEYFFRQMTVRMAGDDPQFIMGRYFSKEIANAFLEHFKELGFENAELITEPKTVE